MTPMSRAAVLLLQGCSSCPRDCLFINDKAPPKAKKASRPTVQVRNMVISVVFYSGLSSPCCIASSRPPPELFALSPQLVSLPIPSSSHLHAGPNAAFCKREAMHTVQAG